MSTTLLTYGALEELVNTDADHNLDIQDVAVGPFGDDQSPIELGRTATIVAQMRFLATDAAVALLKKAKITVCKGDVVLAIDDRGVVSTAIPDCKLDGDHPAQWLDDHYKFVFRVRGIERTPTRPFRREPVDVDQIPTIYPWIEELSTFAVRGDVIDIDFEIAAKLPVKRATKRLELTRHRLAVPLDQALLGLALSVEGDYESPEKLLHGNYWVPIHSDCHPDLKLRIDVKHVKPCETEKSQSEAPVDRTHDKPASKASKPHPNG